MKLSVDTNFSDGMISPCMTFHFDSRSYEVYYSRRHSITALIDITSNPPYKIYNLVWL